MNSIYKRYLIITLALLVFGSAWQICKLQKMLKDVDEVVDYVSENGSLNGFDVDIHSNECVFYVSDYKNEFEEKLVAEFDNVSWEIGKYMRNIGIWDIIGVVLIVMLYYYERSRCTADFCAALPIKKRNLFAAKAMCVIAIILPLAAISLWGANAFNMRVDDCTATLQTLNQLERYGEVAPIVISKASFAEEILIRLAAIGALFLIAELTNRLSAPACILISGAFALGGALEGAYGYADDYFKVEEIIKHTYLSSERLCIIYAVLALVFLLWGMFLSDRADLSRKGKLFRFAWAEVLVLCCIGFCAFFCTYVVLRHAELNYSLTALAAAVVMALCSAASVLLGRYIIIKLGR